MYVKKKREIVYCQVSDEIELLEDSDVGREMEI